MLSPFKRAGRHHTVVAAYLALFTALGGSAYAAFEVTGDEIVDGTVRTADLADDAVTPTKIRYSSVDGAKIINGSVTGPDVGNESLTGYDIADGSVRGPDLGLATVKHDTTSEWAMSKTATASCPSGKKAVGGGGEIRRKDGEYGRGPENLVSLVQSSPEGSSGWTVRGEVIDRPGIPEFTFAYDDGYVTGFSSYIVDDDFSYTGPWVLRAWAVCG
jgi:hypothetical protein